ncbi:MAG: DUF6293 family protein [Nitrososphaeraceae archaeon]
MALNKNLIEPLLSWRFITESKVGSHHIISLTEDGKQGMIGLVRMSLFSWF